VTTTVPARVRRDRGTTLIEVLTALAIASIVTTSLHLLVGSAIKARLIVNARVADQEQGRLALAFLADRLRQVNYDPRAACPQGVLRIGSGNGFSQRLAFRAVLDETQNPPRSTYVYYLEGQTLWQETLEQESPDQCAREQDRLSLQRERVAITPPIVSAFRVSYLSTDSAATTDPERVRLISIVLTVRATGASGRQEAQTYATTVGIRGP